MTGPLEFICPPPLAEQEAEQLRQKIEQYKHSRIWKEGVAMKHRIAIEKIDSLIDEFLLDVICNSIRVVRFPSFFNSWLSNKLQNENDRQNNQRKQSGHPWLPDAPGYGLIR